MLCYEPIKHINELCMKGQRDELWPKLQKLGVNLKSEEQDLMKRVIHSSLPASSTLLEIMIDRGSRLFKD